MAASCRTKESGSSQRNERGSGGRVGIARSVSGALDVLGTQAKVDKVFLQEHSHVHICTYMCGGSPESVMGITLAVDLGTTGAREVHTENVI